jgi:hypothetical protein
MSELIPYLASYGLPGVLLAALGYLLHRLIDRGFEVLFRIPPNSDARED